MEGEERMAGGLDDGHALKLKHLLCQSLGQRNGRVFSGLRLSLSMGTRRLVVALRQSAKICTALRTWRCHQQRSYHFTACELKMRTVITIQRFRISSQTSSIRARHKSQCYSITIRQRCMSFPCVFSLPNACFFFASFDIPLPLQSSITSSKSPDFIYIT